MIRFRPLQGPHLFPQPYDLAYTGARESFEALGHIPSALAQYGTSERTRNDHTVRIADRKGV